jgi:type 1 glutamine amidotransferase
VPSDRVKHVTMRRTPGVAGVAACCLAGLLAACAEPGAQAGLTPSQRAAIEAAIPDRPIVPAAQARSLLIFNLCKGYEHESIPWTAFTIARMGEKTGAYTAVVSSDTTMFRAEQLTRFDAVLFNNNTGEPFGDPALRASLLAFVRGGGGVVGLHAATDGFFEWPEFGEMMGAYFVNHPWNEEVTLRIEEPDHPITAAFDSSSYVVADEIYQFRDPYSRDRLRVLISLDTARLDLEREGVQRADRDFAVSWVREEGAGRVFYSSLGHRSEIFTDPVILRHWLAGIQFALGDLEADATPRQPPR